MTGDAVDDNGEAIVIRPARPDDALGLAAIYVESAEHHARLDPDTYRVPDIHAVTAKMERQVAEARSDFHVIVAAAGGRVVGSADVRMMRTSDPASMIRPCVAASIGLAVLGTHRRRGIGERLMRRAEQWAVDRGAAVTILDMSAANADALRFYTRLGYSTSGLLLRKDLGSPSD